MSVDVLALPFDQYQRYRLVKDLVNEVRAPGERLSVLDVGGRTGLLRAFLPDDDVRLVDLEPSDVEGLVLGDGSRLPYRDKCFDVVASFDTLEHVPPARRAAFVAECARVAKRWIFLAGPYQSPEVEEAEKLLQRFLVDKLGVEHRYLEEHRHNGLPSITETGAGLKKAGASVVNVGHGNLERWLALMCLAMYLDYEPRLRPLASRVFRFYNANLYASDHAAPVYRHAVVGAFAGAKLPSGKPGLAAPVAPAGVLDRFRDVADEVVAFDRARTDWREERARLAEILATLEKDLSGHKSSLEEERTRGREKAAVIATLETDLEGHKETLATLEADLSEHKRSLADTERELTEHKTALATLARELDVEREQGSRVRAELETELDHHREVVRALSTDLEEHRALVTRLANEVDQAKAVVAALEADLAGHRSTLEVVRADLEEHRRSVAELHVVVDGLVARNHDLEEHQRHLEEVVADLTNVRATLEADLEGHRRALADALAERQRTVERYEEVVAEHLRVEAALNQDLDGHRRALGDVRADLEGHRRLAADLRTQIEESRREQARLLDELTRANQDIDGKRGEIARAQRELAANDALIGALRGDLKNRWKSLKRALGPKRPTAGEPGAPDRSA